VIILKPGRDKIFNGRRNGIDHLTRRPPEILFDGERLAFSPLEDLPDSLALSPLGVKVNDPPRRSFCWM